MSIQAINWAWKQEKLTSTEKLVLIALADQADDNGVCWPSMRYLARKVGISKSAVQRAIFILNGPMQLMLSIPRKRNDGGKTSNVYRLNLSNVPLWQDDEVMAQIRAGDYTPLSLLAGTPPVPPKRDTLSQHSGTPCPAAMTPAEEPSFNHHLTKTSAQGFAQFWKAYPKKRSKGTAERAFNRLRPDEQLLGTILSSLERAKTSESWLKDAGQYIPYPATWLNGKGWEDEERVELGHIGAAPRPAILAEMEKPIAATPEGRSAGLAKLKELVK